MCAASARKDIRRLCASFEGAPSSRNAGQFRTPRGGRQSAANGVPVLLHVPHIHTARALRLGGREGDADLSPGLLPGAALVGCDGSRNNPLVARKAPLKPRRLATSFFHRPPRYTAARARTYALPLPSGCCSPARPALLTLPVAGVFPPLRGDAPHSLVRARETRARALPAATSRSFRLLSVRAALPVAAASAPGWKFGWQLRLFRQPPRAPLGAGDRGGGAGPAASRFGALLSPQPDGHAAAVAVFNRSMLKVTMPSSSSSSAASSRAPGAAPAGSAAAAAVPDYWIDGSNRDTLADYYELESELGR